MNFFFSFEKKKKKKENNGPIDQTQIFIAFGTITGIFICMYLLNCALNSKEKADNEAILLVKKKKLLMGIGAQFFFLFVLQDTLR